MIEWLFIIAAAGLVTWVVGRTLIQTFMEEATQVRLVENDRIVRALGSVEKRLREHAIQADRLHEELTRSHGHLKMALENEEQHVRSLELMRAYVIEKIGDVEGTLADGEIVRVGGNRFMFRGMQRKGV